MLLSKANVLCLGVLPMTVLISYVIPKNIESSMFAMISAGIQFSSAWGSEMIGSIICSLYGMNTEDLGQKYSQVLIVKLPLIMTMMMMIGYITLN